MPHKHHPWPRLKSPIGQPVPTAIGVPVVIAGIHTAIGVNLLYHGNVPKITSALYPGLQYNNRWYNWFARNNPARHPCTIGPLISVSEPWNPNSRQGVVAHISPEGTLTESETIETASSRLRGYSCSRLRGCSCSRIRIIPVLVYNSCCCCLLRNQIWAVSTIVD